MVEIAMRNVIGSSKNDQLYQSSNFIDISIDSLQVMELSNTIQDLFKILFIPTLLFSQPTITNLSSLLSSHLLIDDEKVNQKSSIDTSDTVLVGKEWAVVSMSYYFPGSVTNSQS